MSGSLSGILPLSMVAAVVTERTMNSSVYRDLVLEPSSSSSTLTRSELQGYIGQGYLGTIGCGLSENHRSQFVDFPVPTVAGDELRVMPPTDLGCVPHLRGDLIEADTALCQQ